MAKSNTLPKPSVLAKYDTFESVNSNNRGEVYYGTIDRSTGRPSSNVEKAEVKTASYLIPNYSSVWGKRVVDNKTGKPTGEIFFDKPWGEGGSDGYESVRIRYAKNCSSIDEQYQKAINITIADEDVAIEVSGELTYVDPKKDPAKSLFMNVCSLNRDSTCRNPEADVLFGNYDLDKIISRELNQFDIEEKAMAIIREARDDNEYSAILAGILGINSAMPPLEILNTLITKMKSNHALFVKAVEDGEENVRKVVKEAVSKGVLLLDNPGVIQLKNGDVYDVLFGDIGVEISAEQKLEWLYTECTKDAKVYDGVLLISQRLEL